MVDYITPIDLELIGNAHLAYCGQCLAETYVQAAIDQLTLEGWEVSQPDIARVSRLLFKHINFVGRYAFDLPQACGARAGFRLRHHGRARLHMQLTSVWL